MNPRFFPDASALRQWFEIHHATETELLIGFYKVSSGKPSIKWEESVDEAICFGWIDGVRKSIDRETYCIRFTQRKPESNWSAINIRKAKSLKKKGLMHPRGLAAFGKKKKERSAVYSYENRPLKLSADFQKKFKEARKGWDFFSSQAPWYQRTAIYWVMSAKQEGTRIKRLETLILDSKAGHRLKRLSYSSKKYESHDEDPV
jgi:uncharacterized protein YdeI (YjbR/CyaY-like superfamily)